MNVLMAILFISTLVKDVRIGGASSDANAILPGKKKFTMTKYYMHYFFLLMFPAMVLLGNESCVTLTQEDTSIFEDFFKVLCLESEGGYVLYGKKPVCINGFYLEDLFNGTSESHRNSVYLKEGAEAWNRIFEKENCNLIIHLYELPDCLVKNSRHILFIHKELFYKTVQKNLSLFQYVLGPNLTPETLLKKLIDPKETFHNVLKGDKVLIGILLGYTAQNALHISRIENLQAEYLESEENIPFKNKFQSLETHLRHYKYQFLRTSNPQRKRPVLVPSFSYSTFEDEINEALEKIETSSLKLSQNKPNFVFGRLKNSSETDCLIEELEDTQEKIIELFSHKDFLSKILKMIFPDKDIFIGMERVQNLPIDRSSDLIKAVSQNIYAGINDENTSFLEGFYQGLQDADMPNKTPVIKNFSHYDMLRGLVVAKKNVDDAEHLFSDLMDKDFISVSKRVIYKTLRKGSGNVLKTLAAVCINFKIQMPNGTVLKDTWIENQPANLDLKETIEGFAWGMKGMQEGELREIFIHPSAAYGLYTTLDKGIYLKAEVELLSFDASKPSPPFSPITSFDFTPPFNFLAENNFEQISKEEGYALGYTIGTHYKNQPYFSLQELIKALHSNQSSDEDFSSELNRLHWNIYHKEGTSIPFNS